MKKSPVASSQYQRGGGGDPFFWGGQLSVQNFEKGRGQEKMIAWGDLESSCHGYFFLGDVLCFLSKKT